MIYRVLLSPPIEDNPDPKSMTFIAAHTQWTCGNICKEDDSMTMPTIPRILTTAAFCLAAVGLSSCTITAHAPYLRSCSLSPQKASALQNEADVTIYKTDHGGVAYLVHKHIICMDAASVANRVKDEQKAITIHISYLASVPMINDAVKPFLDRSVPIQYITTVNNHDVIPCVYSLVDMNKNQK